MYQARCSLIQHPGIAKLSSNWACVVILAQKILLLKPVGLGAELSRGPVLLHASHRRADSRYVCVTFVSSNDEHRVITTTIVVVVVA